MAGVLIAVLAAAGISVSLTQTLLDDRLDHPEAFAPLITQDRALRAACRYAWKTHGWGEHEPAARLVLPPVNNARHVYLSREQMLAICCHVAHRQARAAIKIAFYSGMRQAEICRAVVQGQSFVLADTKNGLPRVVPIHRRISHIIHTPGLWPITLTTWSISKMFKAGAVAAGLGHARFHDLRHSTASELVNAGVDLFTVGGVFSMYEGIHKLAEPEPIALGA